MPGTIVNMDRMVRGCDQFAVAEMLCEKHIQDLTRRSRSRHGASLYEINLALAGLIQRLAERVARGGVIRRCEVRTRMIRCHRFSAHEQDGHQVCFAHYQKSGRDRIYDKRQGLIPQSLGHAISVLLGEVQS